MVAVSDICCHLSTLDGELRRIGDTMVDAEDMHRLANRVGNLEQAIARKADAAFMREEERKDRKRGGLEGYV